MPVLSLGMILLLHSHVEFAQRCFRRTIRCAPFQSAAGRHTREEKGERKGEGPCQLPCAGSACGCSISHCTRALEHAAKARPSCARKAQHAACMHSACMHAAASWHRRALTWSHEEGCCGQLWKRSVPSRAPCRTHTRFCGGNTRSHGHTGTTCILERATHPNWGVPCPRSRHSVRSSVVKRGQEVKGGAGENRAPARAASMASNPAQAPRASPNPYQPPLTSHSLRRMHTFVSPAHPSACKAGRHASEGWKRGMQAKAIAAPR